ncbi:MAG: 4Fe-4S binding protein [Thermodesulfobacteriota bacterium]|nr:4Fe-4S binding protein [Thermodesulfobacteriota bacterium]
MNFRRASQIANLVLFLLLLAKAIYSSNVPAAIDIYLRLDPGLIALTAIGGRMLDIAFIPALLVLAITPFAGRVFCGYLCPMGTTLDYSDKLFGRSFEKQFEDKRFRSIKYLSLFFLFGASIVGVSWVFFAAPLSLITRFYGLFLHPLLVFIADESLGHIRPMAEWLDVYSIALMQIPTPRFATQMFIIAFFGALFTLARVSPRFWCRNICPSGGLMALLSKKPFVRRYVSEDCTECGRCVAACPMGAISEESPLVTHHRECITCHTCAKICPERAVSFGWAKTDYDAGATELAYSRRQFVITGLIGTGTAITCLTGLSSPYGKPGPGQVTAPGLIRPPGALPEMDFLVRCVRCGECMAACPTNTLQPIWLKAGILGMFSPVLTPRRRYCSPECHKCGDVCPTGAIRILSANERIWAKTGTAMIFRRKCLAWEYQKSCMVCDEVCPFKAVAFTKEPGNPVPVPRVREEKCAGCGYCEHFCPAQNQSAIVVTPMGALRIFEGSFVAEGKRQGLKLAITPELKEGALLGEDDLTKGYAPGFENSK